MRLTDTIDYAEARLEKELRKAQADSTGANGENGGKKLPPSVSSVTSCSKRPPPSAEARESHNTHRNMAADVLLTHLQTDCPEAFAVATLVGQWLWVKWEKKPDRAVLDKLWPLGFSWSHKRQAWMNPCGAFTPRGKGDPREKYGEVKVAAVPEQEQEPIIIDLPSKMFERIRQAAAQLA